MYDEDGFDAPRSGPTPPASLEAEREVLAAVLVDPNAIDTIAEKLTAEDFYFEINAIIFDAMMALRERNRGIDPVTLRQELKDRGQYEKIGEGRAIGELLDRAGTVANVEHYCDIVSDKATIRRYIDAGRSIWVAGLQDVDDVDAFAAEAERSILGLREGDRDGGGGLVPIEVAIVKALDASVAAMDSGDDVVGLRTHFRDADRLLRGMRPGNLLILAGRPGMGKSALAMQIAENVAVKDQAPVAVFSLEMPDTQVGHRLLSNHARVEYGNLELGRMDGDCWSRVTEGANKIGSTPMYLDDSSNLTPELVRARCRRLQRKLGRKLGLVVIDYLQLMRGSGKHGTREQEVTAISRALKVLSKDLGCPVLALSQLNRSLESRTDKRPLMSDLRESGAIEQDADVILFVYREDAYDPDCAEELRGVVELIVAKNRNGAPGVVRLKWTGPFMRFDTLFVT